MVEKGYVAILRRNDDRTGDPKKCRAVRVPKNKEHTMYSKGEDRQWLTPHLGRHWHLCSFVWLGLLDG